MNDLINRLVNDVTAYKKTDSNLLISTCERLLSVVGDTNDYVRQFAIVNLMVGKFDCGKFSEVLDIVSEHTDEISSSTFLDIKLQFHTIAGITYKNTLDEYSALISLQNALYYGKAIDDQMGVGAVYCNMADVYRKLGAYEEARAIYEHGNRMLLNSKKNRNNIRYNPNAYHFFLCKVELAEHRLKEATFHLEKIREYSVENNNVWDPYYKECLFLYYMCIEDYSRADEFIEKFIEEDEPIDDIHIRFQIYHKILSYVVRKNKRKYFEKVKEKLYTIIQEMNILEYYAVVYELFIDYYEQNQIEVNEEILSLYQDFERVTRRLTIKQKNDQSRHISAYMEIIEEIEELEKVKKAKIENQKRANEDSMTGIFNRRGIDAQFRKNFKVFKNSKADFAIGMIDVDYFKQYNDYYGHLQGDEILKKIAGILKKRIQNLGFVGRYGGDEFVFFFNKTQNLEKVIQLVMEDVKKEKILHKESKVSDYVTLTLGIIIFKMDNQKGYQYWVNKADLILLEQKEEERGHYKLAIYNTKEEC